MNEDKALRGLRIVRNSIIVVCLIFVAIAVAYVVAGYFKLTSHQKAADRIQYAAYGVHISSDYERDFVYASKPGFHGDKCTAVNYKTNGDETLFSDFTDGADGGAEQQMNFVLKSADVPEELRPDYSQSYKWKLIEKDDNSGDSLVVIYFPEQEAVYFGETIM